MVRRNLGLPHRLISKNFNCVIWVKNFLRKIFKKRVRKACLKVKKIQNVCNKKVKLALDKGLTPIYCNGETLEQRKAGQHLEVVKNQTETALFTLNAEEIKKVVIAYEPVWAIGTGETASPEQAQEIHAHIRSLIAAKYGQEVADEISILYGGSVKPDNAKEIFSQPDIDGGLIGGAALKLEDFSKIIEGFN